MSFVFGCSEEKSWKLEIGFSGNGGFGIIKYCKSPALIKSYLENEAYPHPSNMLQPDHHHQKSW